MPFNDSCYERAHYALLIRLTVYDDVRTFRRGPDHHNAAPLPHRSPLLEIAAQGEVGDDICFSEPLQELLEALALPFIVCKYAKIKPAWAQPEQTQVIYRTVENQLACSQGVRGHLLNPPSALLSINLLLE